MNWENQWFAGGKKFAWLDWIAIGGIAACLVGEYVNIAWYAKIINYVPLAALGILVLFFYNHVNWIVQLKQKDWKLILVIAGVLIELVNIKLSHSRFGVILNITSLFLIFYLADKMKLDNRCYYFIGLVSGLCFLTWVGQGDKGYNTNMAAMSVMILAVGTMPGVGCWLKKKDKERLYRWFVLVITGVVAYLSWKLKARGCLLGATVIIGLSLLITQRAWSRKWLYQIAVSLFLIGATFFPMIYVWSWKTSGIKNFVWMNKNFYSGRQDVWGQFIEAFTKEPLTGIGSDILLKIPNTCFTEVHNGLLHVLVIYGAIIYGIILILLMCIFLRAWDNAQKSFVVKGNILLAIGMLSVSVFENYIILPSFSLVFFLLLTKFETGDDNDKRRK